MLNRIEQRTPLSIVDRNPQSKPRPLAMVAPLPAVSGPKANSDLVTGIVIGLVFGFILGTLAALIAGDKSLLFAQHLWNRISNPESEGDKVHFEWLLQ